MELTVIYDNEVFDGTADLRKEWGFSCLIDAGVEKILFDTGGDGEILLHNMREMGIDPRSIDKVVISHEHWDHNGGLKELSPLLDSAVVYDLSDRKNFPGTTHHHVREGMEISRGIRTTGPLRGDPVNEQSVVMEGTEGLWVLTGCSHSEVPLILEQALRFGKVIGLIGGFHGLEDLSVLKGLGYIYPMHCTVRKEEILEMYGSTAFRGGVGTRIII